MLEATVAYANQHYAAGISGWRTDRGRIYIQYGPPDEIESHPSGDSYQRPPEQGGGVTSTYPFEQWLYHYIQGIGKDVMFEFVDSNRKGEYRLIPPPSTDAPGTRSPEVGLFRLEILSHLPGTPAPVVISVPADRFAQATQIYGMAINQRRALIRSFGGQRPLTGPYQQQLTLEPGTYRIEISLHDYSARHSYRNTQTITIP